MPTFDDELAKLCCNGQPEAFNILMSRWQHKVLNLAYHYLGNAHDAHDVCQEAFMRAFRNIRIYEPRPSFAAWLYRITLTVVLTLDRGARPSPAPADSELLQREWPEQFTPVLAQPVCLY